MTTCKRAILTEKLYRYFLFQAALIPCICLRNVPHAPEAAGWCEQISTTLQTIQALASVNASSPRCYQVILKLCNQYLRDPQLAPLPPTSDQPAGVNPKAAAEAPSGNSDDGPGDLSSHPPSTSLMGDVDYPPPDEVNLDPIDESPQTQINHVFPMMWPNATALEAAEEVMGGASWIEFLRGGVNGDLPPWDG